jgi:hypothetical protein
MPQDADTRSTSLPSPSTPVHARSVGGVDSGMSTYSMGIRFCQDKAQDTLPEGG